VANCQHGQVAKVDDREPGSLHVGWGCAAGAPTLRGRKPARHKSRTRNVARREARERTRVALTYRGPVTESLGG